MIEETIKLLRQNDFYNVSDNVEIAKGKYEIATNWTTVKDKLKRLWHTKKKL